MFDKQVEANNTIENHKSFQEGDLVRLRFAQGLYGTIVKTGLVDQNSGNPLLQVAWQLVYDPEKEELLSFEIPQVQVCSKEALILLSKKDERVIQ